MCQSHFHIIQKLIATWSDAGLVLAHGVEREVVDVPVVLVPRLEEGDHAVEQQEEEEDQNESLLATHLERNDIILRGLYAVEIM